MNYAVDHSHNVTPTLGHQAVPVSLRYTAPANPAPCKLKRCTWHRSAAADEEYRNICTQTWRVVPLTSPESSKSCSGYGK